MLGQIKAIETVYKGFRFRSRLEARWAVFFDQLRLRWEYEREGYDLDGMRYLPDFFLPDGPAFVEVKPGPAPRNRVPSVYMAGRMGAPYLDGEAHGRCYRPFDIYREDVADLATVEPVSRRLLGLPIEYTGPFMTGNGNHACVHGDADDGMGNEDNCFMRALNGIRHAEFFFAWLEDLEAFGTLAEIGYAHALKKRVVIGLGGAVAEAIEIEVDNHNGIRHAEEGAATRYNHLWFPCRMAEKILVGKREDVLTDFASWLDEQSPRTREQIIIDRLCEGTGHDGYVVYGDPQEVFCEADNGIYENRHGDEWDCVFVRARARGRTLGEAALAARQARFEHGRSGAPA